MLHFGMERGCLNCGCIEVEVSGERSDMTIEIEI